MLDLVTGDMPTTTRVSTGTAIKWTVAGIVASFLGGHAAVVCPAPAQSSIDRGFAWANVSGRDRIVVFLLLTSTVCTRLGGAFDVLKNTIVVLAHGPSPA